MGKLCTLLIKLYRDFLYVPKEGKVRDKAMLFRLILSAVLIVGCMAAMSITAYAYYSCSVTSGANMIQSATYRLDITPPPGMAPAESYLLDNTNGNGSREFIFKLTRPTEDNIASVGYCKIIVNGESVFYTKPIGTYRENGSPVVLNERTVIIEVPKNEKVTVRFVAEWGSCAKTPVAEETISISPTVDPGTDLSNPPDMTTDPATQNASPPPGEKSTESNPLPASDSTDTRETQPETDPETYLTDGGNDTGDTEDTEVSHMTDRLDSSDSDIPASSETDVYSSLQTEEP